ncbi:glycoside hydrolase family 16 protein [Goodfellowiella coeruleoviolacea]|uniref:Glycosyl hydrolases family 16 n=1 Tax=Goodfellowiella coeruleoviolacea TaxID=334858 RepID=A0AAE3KHY7_9PSEU|nr:family 16 glycosylhydrolase [Goodfellowiella coeruleoviolacea]MCP2167392.1 Glycosyl hydrolases family 16 [Goodfellowiella coeruleoviolacea]
MDTLDATGTMLDATGWRPLWKDDFRGPHGAPLDHERWKVIVGKPWASGMESYADDTTHLHLDGDGHLAMTATHDEDNGYVSAWIETRREDFVPPPGGALRVRARVRTAPGLGVDCAMFAWANRMRHLGEQEPLQGWYQSGEIDLFEVVNSEPARVYGVVHSPECHQLPSLGMGTFTSTADGSPLSDDYHTYTTVWTHDPDSITWYLDGTPYLRLTPEDTTAKGWLFTQPVYFGLLIVIGSPGGPILPGDPDPAAFPTTMFVDEVTIEELPPGGGAPNLVP